MQLPATPSGFTFRGLTIDYIASSVNYLKSQARGIDSIRQLPIRIALPAIGSYIWDIFNQSLQKGIFPSLWKSTIIIPVNEVNSPTSPSDFRPIALLCFLSKSLESVVSLQLNTLILRIFLISTNLVSEWVTAHSLLCLNLWIIFESAWIGDSSLNCFILFQKGLGLNLSS